MAQPVSIKGTKSGIILVLDETIPFIQLKELIEQKFIEASSFLGHSSMGLIVRGRRLSDAEEAEVLDIISRTTQLNIVCILDENHPLDAAFTKMVSGAASSENSYKEQVQPQAIRPELSGEERQQLMDQAYNEAYQAAFEQIGDANARIHVGNIRSGQEIISQHSIIVFGDVHPGGSIVSAGCIFVFGALKGNAFAGATGDQNAFVVATDFKPLQVRIADAIAVSEDETVSKSKRLLRRKTGKNTVSGPEVAYTYQGAIARSEFNSKYLRSNQFFK